MSRTATAEIWNELRSAQAEIERLRAALEEQNGAIAIMHKARNAAIEECARVAESDKWDDYLRPQPHIADAIRALKDKP